ncbi:MAG: metal ABC transporter permease [Burkholderiales bacterium]|nr:metal ABC transporter permease [Burkholderiales bacterium]
MLSPEVEIQIIAAVVAAACALLGVFLVLRRMALMSDAISHSILFGIVLAFFVVEDITSPFLILAATATGMLAVILVELLNRTRLVKEDASIALVFPLLFSIGVILIARYAGNVHLDVDAVLLGELAFAPFNRLVIDGADYGARMLWVMSVILALNAAFVALCYKELKLSTFDTLLAHALGFSPAVIHYVLMALVSVTTVGAFDAVGSILVVALMIAPPAAAYLLTDRLSRMIFLSVAIGIASALSGYWLARVLDASIAGSMATMSGVLFVLAWLCAAERGLIALAARRRRQRWEFAQMVLAVHLHNHEKTAAAAIENCVEHLGVGLRWRPDFAREVVKRAEKRGLVQREGEESLQLTKAGRGLAHETMTAGVLVEGAP